MGAAGEDWLATLDALLRGDRVALVKITNVITCFLTRYRAYELRESWEDLCQEVLVALIRSAQKGVIREPRAFISYLGQITRNKLLDWIEHQKRPGSPDPVGDPELAANEIARTLSPDLMIDLQEALRGLPEKTRQVVEAIYLEGRSYEEASRRVGVPLGTLKRMQTQGLRELRDRMGIVARREIQAGGADA